MTPDPLRPRIRLNLAMTLDGFIADAKGGVDWLAPYPPEDFGIAGLMDRMDAIVMGRTTYDQIVSFGEWPYEGKRVVVLTRRRPSKLQTPLTETWSGDAGPLADRLVAESRGDIWIMGGGAAARGFLAAGRLDSIELFVIPVLLGKGIPLFGPGTTASGLRLVRAEPLAKGVLRLDYVPDV